MPAEDRTALKQILRELSVRTGDFVLSSGKRSNLYIDARLTTCHARAMPLIGRAFLDKMDQLGWRPSAVGGLTMGADPLASAVATVSYLGPKPLNAFYVRQEPKKHGTGQWIEGRKLLRQGMPVAILEDVVTTGGSALKAVARAREFGLKVSLIIGLVDREEGGREALEREAKLVTLFRRSEFA